MIPHVAVTRRMGATLITLTVTAAVLLTTGNTANAAIAPTVPLATSANYAVLGASTVTNTGDSTLDGSLGLWPGTSITGFPPGLVFPPGKTDTTNAAAQQAQSDLTVAYVNAAGRPLDATTKADLANLKLGAGVYAGPSKSPLSLSGPLILDGAGDLSSVFIFQTDSTLITGSSSTVTLINGAQECNVFWQVGSSATLGTDSVFVGNILALASITVNNSVTVHGRALARNAAVKLDNDTFTRPTCAPLSVSAAVVGVGVTPNSVMDAPMGPAEDPVWQQAFWYRGSAVPGARSTALIAGHVGGHGRPAVFAHLDRIRPGDPIVVHDTRNGLDVRFSVTESKTYSLDEASDPAVLTQIYGVGPVAGTVPQPSADGLSHLTLITCAGTFKNGTHDHRLAVYATRIA